MKKQIISIVLAVSMLATMLTAFMLPAVAEEIDRVVMVTEETITVDGVCEESYLESSPIKSIYKIKDTNNTKLSFEGYMLATYQGVYIWVGIHGDTTYVNTVGTNVHDFGGDNRDYLQIYYNMSNAGKTDNIGYIMHDYNNSTYFRNQAGSANSGYTKTAPAGYSSAAVKTEDGWASEMFIPWHSGTPLADSMSAKDIDAYFSIGFQYNDDYEGDNKYNCAVYDKATTSYWSDYTLMPQVEFARNFGRLSKTNVFLDGDIALDYTVNLGAEYDISRMAVKYTITGANGTEEVIVKGSVTDAATDTFNFSYGIAPQRMNDTVAVELLYDDQVIHSRPAFTVRDYCVEMYNESAEDLKQTANQNLIMKQLIVDMLNYGASAQLYTNYDKDNLVNAGFEAEVEDRVVEYQDIVVSDTIPGYTNTRFVSTNLYFDSSNRICFKFKATDIDNTIVTISDGSGALAQTLVPTYIPEEDAYIVATDLIDAADYDHVFTARICHVNDKGTDWESYTVIQSVSCNVNAYLAEIIRTSTDANMVKLAQAAYNYGQSASAFAAA